MYIIISLSTSSSISFLPSSKCFCLLCLFSFYRNMHAFPFLLGEAQPCVFLTCIKTERTYMVHTTDCGSAVQKQGFLRTLIPVHTNINLNLNFQQVDSRASPLAVLSVPPLQQEEPDQSVTDRFPTGLSVRRLPATRFALMALEISLSAYLSDSSSSGNCGEMVVNPGGCCARGVVLCHCER